VPPIILHVDPSDPDRTALEEAGARIRRGELVAFPTETVYGLGADALNASAVRKIFKAKGRPSTNPVIVHVADVAAAQALSSAWPETATRLAARFWPGPLTIVVPAGPEIPPEVTAGRPSVGLRMPAHPVAMALLRAAGVPIAAPSANRSNQVSPTTAAHVAASLGEDAGLILDGGPSDVGIESTVLDLTGTAPIVLRPGGIGRDQLEAVLGPVALATGAVAEATPRSSPGMMARHYAPKARLIVAPGPHVAASVVREKAAGHRVGLLLIGAEAPRQLETIRLPPDPAGYARGLYAALHRLDRETDVIIVEAPPDDRVWEGIHDRLRRAGHPA
jgi:L-threonylcarbamoyladenylate synthase